MNVPYIYGAGTRLSSCYTHGRDGRPCPTYAPRGTAAYRAWKTGRDERVAAGKKTRPCPSCGGVLAKTSGAVAVPVMASDGTTPLGAARPCVFWACGSCEFCVEADGDTTAKSIDVELSDPETAAADAAGAGLAFSIVKTATETGWWPVARLAGPTTDVVAVLARWGYGPDGDVR